MSVSMTVPQARRNECSVNGSVIHLMPKPSRLLECLLLVSPDRFVSRDRLIEYVWPNPDDEPDSAIKAISVYLLLLRKAGIQIETESPNKGNMGWRIRASERGQVSSPVRLAA